MDRLRNPAQLMPVRVPETGLKVQDRSAINKWAEINLTFSVIASSHRCGPNDALILAKAEPIQGAKLITERISAVTVVSEEHFQQGKRDAEVKTDKRKPIKAKEKHHDARIVARDSKDGKLSQEGVVKPSSWAALNNNDLLIHTINCEPLSFLKLFRILSNPLLSMIAFALILLICI